MLAKQRYINTARFARDYIELCYSNKEDVSSLYQVNENIGRHIKGRFENSRTRGLFNYELISSQELLSSILERMHNDLTSESLIKLATRAKLLDNKSIKINMVKSIIEQIDTYSPSSIPIESQKVLKEVNQLFLDVHNLSLNQEQQFTIDNLYKKRLPQIMTEYLTIPEKFRKQLNSLPENPNTLLLDSLNQIKVILNEISQHVQTDNVKAMKISNTYLKSM